MSDRGHSRERDGRRSRRRSPSPRASRSPSPPPRRNSRSPSHHRSKRSPPAARPPPNEVHRENPIPSACLGVFGLSQHTTERDLKDMFYKFGRVKDIQIVIDKKTNKSRGFGFVYFEEVDSAARAKEALNSTELDHHRLRIDFSVTKRAHTPTPGIYMGVRPSSYYRSNGHGNRRSPSPDRRSSHRRHRHRYDRSRSRSHTRSRSRSRSRSRHRGDRRRRRSPGYA